MWNSLTTRVGGGLRAVRAKWKPHRVRVEDLRHGSQLDAPLHRWLMQVADQGIGYEPLWRHIEHRITRLFESQPGRITTNLADRYMGGVDVFEFIHVNGRGGRFLSALTRRYAAPTVVEIGTAFGVSGMYLLAGIGDGRLWTFDPCDDWREVSTQNLASIGSAYTRIDQRFEIAFPQMADGMNPIHVAFVDGLHTYEHVTREVGLLHPYMAEGGVLILHDVDLDEDMRTAWKQIRRHPRVLCSAFVERQFGVCELGPVERQESS